jgi:hypothetical protein
MTSITFQIDDLMCSRIQPILMHFLQTSLCTDQWCIDSLARLTADQLLLLIEHPVGNASLQALFGRCCATPSTRVTVLSRLATTLPRSYEHKYGSLIWQDVISCCSEVDDGLLLDLLSEHLLPMSQHPTGHFVLVSLIETFSSHPRMLSTLWTKLIAGDDDPGADHQRFWELATRIHGHRLLQGFLSSTDGVAHTDVCQHLIRHAIPLAHHAQGNYIIQSMLKSSVAVEHESALLARWEGKFAGMACHKFASNVVETCLRTVSRAWSDRIVNELLQRVELLIQHRYGNFVLQTATETTMQPRLRALLARAIEGELQNLSGGLHAKWSTIAGHLSERPSMAKSQHPSPPCFFPMPLPPPPPHFFPIYPHPMFFPPMMHPMHFPMPAPIPPTFAPIPPTPAPIATPAPISTPAPSDDDDFDPVREIQMLLNEANFEEGCDC